MLFFCIQTDCNLPIEIEIFPNGKTEWIFIALEDGDYEVACYTEEMSKVSDEDLSRAITDGGRAIGKSNLIPAFGANLSAAENGEMVAHLRKMCTCKGAEAKSKSSDVN